MLSLTAATSAAKKSWNATKSVSRSRCPSRRPQPKTLRQTGLPLRAGEDVYIRPAGEWLTHSFTTQEHGLVLRRYLTNVCQGCAIKHRCTTAKERRITPWEHEHILEAVQRWLDEHPEKMRQRRETVEHPFGTIKARMGATHFLAKTSNAGCLRDGTTRSGLQSHPRNQHYRHPAPN
jgi:hypothetical protein